MNRKKIAAIIVFGLTLTTCSSPAVGQVTQKQVLSYTSDYAKPSIMDFFKEAMIKQTMLEAEAKAAAEVQANTVAINKTIKKLKSYVGKTWYVFSGATPQGWDCSGLTMWFYEQLGITLEHRASRQSYAGSETTDPKPGDIVVFTYTGYKSAYHVGIYVGDGMMIHSPRPGYITTLENVDTFAGNYSTVSYRRILETN
jgi:cell wall-associated NlpC family hydrolase